MLTGCLICCPTLLTRVADLQHPLSLLFNDITCTSSMSTLAVHYNFSARSWLHCSGKGLRLVSYACVIIFALKLLLCILQILACVLLQDLGKSADGLRCGELAAFCVHPSHRGSGRGDSLLDYVEQSARMRGIQRLVLLTTRTADWFMQRDFKSAGIAHDSSMLPESRRAVIDPARNSQLFCKAIVALNDTVQAAPAGKRIGF